MSEGIDEKEFAEFVEDSKYLHENYNIILKDYDQQYIAIKNKEIVAHSKDISRFKEQLEAKGIKVGSVASELIRDKSNFL